MLMIPQIYVDTLQNIYGCDSIVTLDLTMFYTVFNSDSLVACDSVIWNEIPILIQEFIQNSFNC